MSKSPHIVGLHMDMMSASANLIIKKKKQIEIVKYVNLDKKLIIIVLENAVQHFIFFKENAVQP